MLDRRREVFVVFSVLLFSFTLGVSSPSSEISTIDEKIHVVVGDGSASIVKNTVDKARQIAVARALQDGVLQSISVLITPEQAAKAAEDIQKHILPRAQKYVRDFRIIRENEKLDIYSVRLQATIDRAKLKADISGLSIQGVADFGPLTLLMMVERDDAFDTAHYWWDISQPIEAALTSSYRWLAESLENRGFRMVAGDESLQEIRLQGSALPPDVSDEDAAELGKVLGADIVIIVQAEVSRSAGKSCRVMIWSRGIDVDSLRLLDRAESEEAEKSDDLDWACEEAFRRCCLKILDSLQDIVDTWHLASSDTINVKLTLKGIRNYGYFLQIQRILTERIPEIQFLPSFSIETGVYHVEARFQGPIKYLANSLKSVPYGEFELQVEEKVDGSLTLHVRFPDAVVNQ